VVLFRMARPEALLNPESSNQVLDVLKSIRMPKEALLPSTWLAEVVVRGGDGQWAPALAGAEPERGLGRVPVGA